MLLGTFFLGQGTFKHWRYSAWRDSKSHQNILKTLGVTCLVSAWLPLQTILNLEEAISTWLIMISLSGFLTSILLSKLSESRKNQKHSK